MDDRESTSRVPGPPRRRKVSARKELTVDPARPPDPHPPRYSDDRVALEWEAFHQRKRGRDRGAVNVERVDESRESSYRNEAEPGRPTGSAVEK